MAQNQKFYKSRHTGKEIDDAIDSIGQIDKVLPTDISVDSEHNLILEHDGTEITGQKKQVVVPPWTYSKYPDTYSIPNASLNIGEHINGWYFNQTYMQNANPDAPFASIGLVYVNPAGNNPHYEILSGSTDESHDYNPDNWSYKLAIPHKSGTLAVTSEVDTKVSKSGDTITGNLTIQGNLSVSGTTTTVDTETLKVKDNVIVTNSDKNKLIDLSGLAINTDATNTFGIMYNPTSNTVNLGLGTITTEGKFTYNENEGLPLAIRDMNNSFTQDHLISWSTDKNKLVDSGIDKSVINNKLDKFTEPSETSRIYLVSTSGAQAMGNVDFTATAYYIPRYSAQATLTTQTPQKDIDCTNKQYVDNAIASVTIEVIDLSKGN